MMEEVGASFNSLPEEVALIIFGRVSHDERKKSRLVCHHWRFLLDNNSRKYFTFKLELNDKLGHPDLEAFITTDLTLDHVKMEKLTLLIPNDKDPLPKFRIGVLGSDNSAENVARFLKWCENSQFLKIKKFSLAQITQAELSKAIHQEVPWNSRRLSLSIYRPNEKTIEGGDNHILNSTIFLKTITLGNLVTFEFKFKDNNQAKSTEEILELQNCCLSLYEFLANHAKSLKILQAAIINEVSDSDSDVYKFSIPEIPSDMKESIRANLRLNNCTLDFKGVEQMERLVIPELFGSELKEISLTLDYSELAYKSDTLKSRELVKTKGLVSDTQNPIAEIERMSKFNENMEKIFRANGKSLQRIRISRLPILNFQWFENCSSLVQLMIFGPSKIQGFASPLTFQPSSATLRCAMIYFLDNVDLTMFQKCLKLESLLVSCDVSAGTVFEQLPPQRNPAMSLNSLELYSGSGGPNNSWNHQIQEIINRSGNTLQFLDLDVSGEFTLKKCNALIFMSLHGSGLEANLGNIFTGCSSLNFVHLRQLDISIKPGDELLISGITENMNNLEMIKTLMEFSVPLIQTFLQMPKMKRIGFSYQPAFEEALDEFIEQNPQLECYGTEECMNKYFETKTYLYWIIVAPIQPNFKELESYIYKHFFTIH